jgi:hypothetical protein
LTTREGDRGSQEYAPLDEHTGLFLSFASIEPTESAILAFANAYGLLGICSSDGKNVQADERRTTWVQQIHAMHGTLGLWQHVRNQQGESAKKNEFYNLVNEHLQQSLWSTVLGRPEHEDAARRVFEKAFRRSGPARPRMQIVRASQSGKLVLEIEPANLLGALWMQFALAVVNDTQFRQCLSCGSWFAVSPETRRVDAVYCKEACRIRAYKERKKEARRLVAAGKTLGQIAKELGTTRKIVEGWVTESRA